MSSIMLNDSGEDDVNGSAYFWSDKHKQVFNHRLAKDQTNEETCTPKVMSIARYQPGDV